MCASPGSLVLCLMTEREKGKATCRKYLDHQLGCVKAVDENVGRVQDYCDKTGLAKHALVIDTADDGMFPDEHGCFDKRKTSYPLKSGRRMSARGNRVG